MATTKEVSNDRVETPLKSERLKRGWRSVDVAAKAGVQHPTINRIENGKTRPSPELAIRLVEIFGGALTRDEILFPEFYTNPGKKPPTSSGTRKPIRNAQLQEAR